jgi:hypothetical protein
VLANGPVRAVFELSYDAWDAGGTQVRRSSASRSTPATSSTRSTAPLLSPVPSSSPSGIGLNKTPSDKKQDPQIAVVRNEADPSLLQWVAAEEQWVDRNRHRAARASGFAEDALNHLVLAKVESGKPLRYYAGAAWDRAGHIVSQEPGRPMWRRPRRAQRVRSG